MDIKLTCDMTRACERDVAYIDDKGYVYCEIHGKARQMSRSCRKLRKGEINRLKRGETISYRTAS